MASHRFDSAAPFVVLYWHGGSEVGHWFKMLDTFASYDAARAAVEELVKAGRPGYVRSQRELDTIGWPEGPPPSWDFKRLQWRKGGRKAA